MPFAVGDIVTMTNDDKPYMVCYMVTGCNNPRTTATCRAVQYGSYNLISSKNMPGGQAQVVLYEVSEDDIDHVADSKASLIRDQFPEVIESPTYDSPELPEAAHADIEQAISAASRNKRRRADSEHDGAGGAGGAGAARD